MTVELLNTPESHYGAAEVQQHKIEDASIALRVFGQGPALVFIHGFPLSGYTWRKLLPELAKQYSCYVVDLPGLGDSDWQANTDFSFTAQACRLGKLFTKLALKDFTIIAQDTGATLARLTALLPGNRVTKLAILNTEIPGHRPPWIPFYQTAAKLPLAASVFKVAMRSKGLVQSSMMLGQFYSNRELFNTPSYELSPYIKPLTSGPLSQVKGALRYLQGIDWQAIDGLREGHKNIKAEVQAPVYSYTGNVANASRGKTDRGARTFTGVSFE